MACSLRLFIWNKHAISLLVVRYFFLRFYSLSLYFITGVWCINIVRPTCERSLLWYRRIPALQVYAKVPMFQLERRQSILHQGQQREFSNRCRRVSVFHLSLFVTSFSVDRELHEVVCFIVFLVASSDSGWTVTCTKAERSPAARMATIRWHRAKTLLSRHWNVGHSYRTRPHALSPLLLRPLHNLI